MSESAPEPTTLEQTDEQKGAPTSYPVSLVVLPSGRQHGINGGATVDFIRDENGDPETDYVLAAEIDGVQVPLQSFSRSALDQLASSEKARQAADAES